MSRFEAQIFPTFIDNNVETKSVEKYRKLLNVEHSWKSKYPEYMIVSQEFSIARMSPFVASSKK